MISRFIFAVCLFVAIANTEAQNYTSVDKHAKEAPAKVSANIKALAAYLSKPATSETEKVRAFYTWIANNISYDVKSFLQNKLIINDSVGQVLVSRKGVCQDYAALMEALCKEVGIQSFIVDGYSKGFGYSEGTKHNKPDHSWNAIYADGQWRLLDATWGSGYIDEKAKFVRLQNDRYFFTPPQEMVFNHLPTNPMWQLLSCPVPIDIYEKDSIAILNYLNKKEKCFSYLDSINEFKALNVEEALLKSAISGYNFNPRNKLNIGLAYMNYGVFKTQLILDKKDVLKPAEMLEAFNNVLSYFKTAERYLVQAKGQEAKQIYDINQQNLESVQTNIKNLKAYLKAQ